jgi:hypothetical protein
MKAMVSPGTEKETDADVYQGHHTSPALASPGSFGPIHPLHFPWSQESLGNHGQFWTDPCSHKHGTTAPTDKFCAHCHELPEFTQ